MKNKLCKYVHFRSTGGQIRFQIMVPQLGYAAKTNCEAVDPSGNAPLSFTVKSHDIKNCGDILFKMYEENRAKRQKKGTK